MTTYCSTCGYPAPCGRCEDSDNPSARVSSRWVCSGDGPGSHVECRFATYDYSAAVRHFEQTAHAVDEVLP
jgi:hypothetical protein